MRTGSLLAAEDSILPKKRIEGKWEWEERGDRPLRGRLLSPCRVAAADIIAFAKRRDDCSFHLGRRDQGVALIRGFEKS
jgi:hypothetical protein